jgi:hypothetical protein
MVAGSRGFRVVGAKAGLKDGQGALVEGTGDIEVALAYRTLARLLRLVAVWGWSGPKRVS